MPDWVVGIDVDAYGSKVGWESFKQLLERCGDLPATWCSTSRDDGKSGIRFYQIPEGTGWRKAHPPEHIDIIRAAHRYAVVWPSIHPEGRQYRWIDPDGEYTVDVPRPEWLPELPETWLKELFPPENASAPGLRAPRRSDDDATSPASPSGEAINPHVPGAAPAYQVGPSPYVTGEAVSQEYFEATLEATLDELRTLAVGSRNDALNKAAYKLGSFVPEFITREHLYSRLYAAAEANGLVHDDGHDAVMATISSGLEAVTVVFSLRPEETVAAAPWKPSAPVERPVQYADPDQVEWDFNDLMEATFEEKPWPVPGLIPPGLGMTSAPPKTGKSFFVLDICLAVAAGVPVLGEFPVEQGDVLYAALEDGAQRVQRRAIPRGIGPVPRGALTIRQELLRADEGGLEELEAWCQAHPNRRLIIIDVLQAFRSAKDGGGKKNAYAEDYEALRGLRALAKTYGIGLIVVHHNKKGHSEDFMEEISGSTGLSGAIDYMVMLQRKRADTNGILKVAGRDVEDIEVGLEFTGGRWSVSNMPPEVMNKLMGPTRRKVFDHLTQFGASYIYEMADALGMTSSSVHSALKRLHEDHVVVKLNYASPGKPVQWRVATAEERAGVTVAEPFKGTTR
jgi:hypothetical protein